MPFEKRKIAIIGDLILDYFKYYKAIRLSPEGPAPIVNKINEFEKAGGAGNVANSLFNLGCDVSLLYNQSISEKKQEIQVKKLFDNGIELKPILSDTSKSLPVKIRYYVDDRNFMREDIEDITYSNLRIFDDFDIENLVSNFDLIIISDYCKGFISDETIQKFIKSSNQKSVPLFIDSKNTNYVNFENAFCLKINRLEFNSLFEDFRLLESNSLYEIKNKVEQAKKVSKIKNLVVTLGPLGSILVAGKNVFVSEANNVEIVDITGAGDAFLSAIAFSYLRKLNNNFNNTKISLDKEDLKFANLAAASVISLKGTEPLSRSFLKEQNLIEKKNLKVGFTNGCFDIIHPGHISLLKEAKKNCEYLIVGLNSDLSIKKIKGPNRPINNQEFRMNILKSIKYVDEVIIFDEADPLKLIMKISPDILIKGSDYNEEDIVGANFVKSYGGKILRSKIVKDLSTSLLLDKIKENKIK